ncbi:MAG TPA: hypothetical protein VJ952_02125 [Opitutales bacterium]|nr:hypothetical protein [Opitutales bacterium]
MSKSNKNVQPYWRPNFVDAAELPDIKVIRTDFIINFVAVVLLLLVGFFVLQREYRAYALGKTIQEMEQRIRVAEGSDAASLRLSREFRDLAANIAELEKFYATPVMAHEFLTEITRIRPEELIFSQISLVESLQKEGTAQMVTYRINVSGEVRSLTVLDNFKGKLSGWDLLNFEGYELDIDESLQGRDPETGIFPYTLQITLTPKKDAPAPEDGGADA